MPIDSVHVDFNAQAKAWRKMRDCKAGQTAIKGGRDLYLPKLSNHQPDRQITRELAEARYTTYLARATFYGATENTISSFKGMVLRRGVDFKVPKGPVATQITDNLDLKGTSLPTMVGTAVEEMLTTSRLGLLVDLPTAPVRADGQPLSVADMERANMRPFLVLYQAEAIRNWRMETVNNVSTLTMVVLLENTAEPDPADPFNTVVIPIYRVLKLVKEGNDWVYRNQTFKPVQVQAEANKGGGWLYPATPTTDVLVKVNGKTLNSIPFRFINPSGRPDPTPEKPVLEALADMNIAHYMNTADHENGLHLTGTPTPVFTGFPKPVPVKNNKGDVVKEAETIYLGSENAIITDNDQAKAFFLEFQGQGLTHLKNEIETKENRMAALGAAALRQRRAGVEAADAMEIERQGETSTLAGIATAIEEAFSNSLITMCQWAGLETSEETFVRLNKNFFKKTMDAATMLANLKFLQSGAMTPEQFVEKMKEAEVLPADADANDMAEAAGETDMGSRNRDGVNAKNPNDAGKNAGGAGGGVTE